MAKVRRDKDGNVTAWILQPKDTDKLTILHADEVWSDEPDFVPPMTIVGSQLTLNDLLERIIVLEAYHEYK